MGLRLTTLVGAVVGLAMSGIMLVLIWFGLAGGLRVGHFHLMYLVWPSSLLLVGGWHTTREGVLLLACSVGMNCLVYAGLALMLRWIFGKGDRGAKRS